MTNVIAKSMKIIFAYFMIFIISSVIYVTIIEKQLFNVEQYKNYLDELQFDFFDRLILRLK